MNQFAQRSIDELRSRYELEPELRDRYVEGIFDKDVLTDCFKEAGQTDCIFYEIDTVEMSNDVLSKYQLTSGNKQKVIALARELERLPEESAIRFLVDRDLDHWFGQLPVIPRLRWTTHCTLESYFFTDRFLEKILITIAKANIPDLAIIRESLSTILRDLYIMRLVDRELAFAMQWIDIDKYISNRGQQLKFDRATYLDRLLQKNSRFPNKEAFVTRSLEWEGKLTGDVKNCMRGHDFTYLLSLIVKKFSGIKAFSTEEALQRIFVLFAPEIKDLLTLLE